MSSLDLSTLDNLDPYRTKIAFQKVQNHANQVAAQAKATADRVAAIPPGLTLAQVQAALSAGGSNPLNLTGLVGTSQATAALQASTGGGGTPSPSPNPNPNPIPVPGHVPTPAGGPGQAAGDFIPFGSIQIVNSIDVSGWASTGIVQSLTINGTGFSIAFDKQATWPDVPPGSVGSIQYTLWAIVFIAGQWYGSGVIPYPRGTPVSGGPPSAMGVNWFNTIAWGPMMGYQPAVGETVGFMVTAGNQRNNAPDQFLVQERSNIVTLPYPADSGVMVTYDAPPPGAVDPVQYAQANAIVFSTAAQYPALTAIFPTTDEALAAAEELLRRIIWHENQAGFLSGRQRNPSGLISGDKLTIQFSGSFHAYDVFTLGFAGHATVVNGLNEIGSPNYVPDPGIPD